VAGAPPRPGSPTDCRGKQRRTPDFSGALFFSPLIISEDYRFVIVTFDQSRWGSQFLALVLNGTAERDGVPESRWLTESQVGFLVSHPADQMSQYVFPLRVVHC
jgi:hypothetical protein